MSEIGTVAVVGGALLAGYYLIRNNPVRSVTDTLGNAAQAVKDAAGAAGGALAETTAKVIITNKNADKAITEHVVNSVVISPILPPSQTGTPFDVLSTALNAPINIVGGAVRRILPW
jgi:hypothetical protein